MTTWPAMWPYPDLDDEDAVREYVRRRAGDRCEIRAPGCTWWAGGLHHRKRRAHGGPTTPENLIAICGACHTDSPAAIHRNPETAYQAGTLLHSWDPDPTERWLPGRECGIVSITTATTEEPTMTDDQATRTECPGCGAANGDDHDDDCPLAPQPFEHRLEEALLSLIEDAGLTDDIGEPLEITHAQTLLGGGYLTNDRGLALRLASGAEYLVRITRNR